MRISDWSSDVCSSDLDVPKGPSDKAIPLLENGGTTGIAPVYYFPADHKAQGRKLGETDDTHSSLFWRSSAGWAGVCPERYWRTRDGSGRTGCPGRFSPAQTGPCAHCVGHSISFLCWG